MNRFEKEVDVDEEGRVEEEVFGIEEDAGLGNRRFLSRRAKAEWIDKGE